MCECSELEPCMTETGMTCHWIARDLCSFCAPVSGEDNESLVDLYSEAEANEFLQGLA